ncbi:MAG: exonuclease SbcCD subunit D [Candidatus Fibromonas sp.]|jgi:exonuclease SbcD|nr:exonuclease SbcCD subunit D [Candidatus Fibromonas sp.]
MKILHISDLHIGKSLGSFSLQDEQRHVFSQIIDCVKTEKPSAILIAGDIYDRAVPSVEAVRIFDDFLTELAEENIAVMIISGNHDSPERLNYAARLLADKNISICGAFDGTPHKVVLQDEYGEICFWLMPFIKPLSVRSFFKDLQEPDSYEEAYAAALATANIDYSARNVLVAHQFFTGAELNLEHSESEISPVGGIDAINYDLIEKFDYAALGHLHGSQTVGAEQIRYAGSPLKYSFSECRQKKSLILVELREKGNLEIQKRELLPLHDMREIKGKLKDLTSEETALLADRNDYLRVILTDEEEIIDPLGQVRSVYPNAMYLDFENSRSRVNIAEINADAKKIETLSPYDLFKEFFLEMQGATMTSEQEKVVRELLEVLDA